MMSSLFQKQCLWMFQCRFAHTYKRSKGDWKRLRPMIIERVKRRAKYFPVPAMIPVAQEVYKARQVLIDGVSKLLQFVPVKACRYCSEIYVGQIGHCIRTCRGPKWGSKALTHEWIDAQMNDILVPVETFHLIHMFQEIITHDQRFDFDRIPALVELCIQAGVDYHEYKHSADCRNLSHSINCHDSHSRVSDLTTESKCSTSESQQTSDQSILAERTLQAWEIMRTGTKKLLFVYPVKVCKYCPEVHVGPSGHMARFCGAYKHEKWRGHHMWKSAGLDDLIPPRYVWHPREQDPIPLRDEGKGFYGKAPAIVEMCTQTGAQIPRKYYCGMKINNHLSSLDDLFLDE